jgi:hypothetical protein
VAWDFRDRLGRTVEVGFYFARLESKSATLACRFVLTD